MRRTGSKPLSFGRQRPRNMKSILASLAFCLVDLALGQNLVPNGSFEEYVDCPYSFGQWAQVVGWTSPFNHSADYFNRCAGGVICSVPFNNFGYQEPAHGNAYMGLATFNYQGPMYREIIATDLTQSLQPGVPVYISFKAATGGFGSWAFNSARWKARGPSIRFFNELPSDWEAYFYPNEAALAMSSVLEDTVNWVSVSGMYVPDSAYSHLALTNFFEDSLSMPSILDDQGMLDGAYAFVDDICISYDPNYCVNWASGLGVYASSSFTITQPATNVWLVNSSAAHEVMSVMVHDACGRVLLNTAWQRSSVSYSIDLSTAPTGVYSITVEGGSTPLLRTRVVNIHP
jgi:hypothetical protein